MRARDVGGVKDTAGQAMSDEGWQLETARGLGVEGAKGEAGQDYIEFTGVQELSFIWMERHNCSPPICVVQSFSSQGTHTR